MIYANIEDINKQINNLILDLDGCLFDSRVLLQYIPKNQNDRQGWYIFQEHLGEEIINNEMVKIVCDLANNGLKRIYFVTAREDINDIRLKTRLKITDALFNSLKQAVTMSLYMRKPFDYRDSDIIKQEIYFNHIENKIDKLKTLAIDDDLANIAMYDRLGLDCLHYKKFII